MKENYDFGSSFSNQNPLYRSNTDFLSRKITKDLPKTKIIVPMPIHNQGFIYIYIILNEYFGYLPAGTCCQNLAIQFFLSKSSKSGLFYLQKSVICIEIMFLRSK
jgi:hypothetical protein